MTARSPITTHVLDVSLGKPAAAVEVDVARLDGDVWTSLATGTTDADGRAGTLLAPGSLRTGTHRLRFGVGAYFERTKRASFYPLVEILFVVGETDAHYHVPLLLSPFGYSTYRGS